MNEQELYLALKTLFRKVKGEKIIWYLEGSVNLFVQGAPVIPKDIDITTTPEGLEKFRALLNKEIVKDFYIEENKAHVLKCVIEKQEVEIAVYKEEDKNSFDTIQIMKWKNLNLPIEPLQQALKFYKKIGREDKVRLLKIFIASNSSKQEK